MGDLPPLRTALLSGLVHGAVRRSTLNVKLPEEQKRFWSSASYWCFDEDAETVRNYIIADYEFHLQGLKVSLKRGTDTFLLSNSNSDEFVVNWITDHVLDRHFSKNKIIKTPGSFRGFVSGISATKDLEEKYNYAALCFKGITDLPVFNSFLSNYLFGTIGNTLYFRCFRDTTPGFVVDAVRELLIGDMQDIGSLVDIYRTRNDFLSRRRISHRPSPSVV